MPDGRKAKVGYGLAPEAKALVWLLTDVLKPKVKPLAAGLKAKKSYVLRYVRYAYAVPVNLLLNVNTYLWLR